MTDRPDPDELAQLRVLALGIATEAGAFLLDGLHRPRTALESKSTGTDMVSEMDRGSERLIVDAIRRARPDDGLLGEEGTDEAGRSGYRWVIDPLDGTTNYLYAHPLWSVSIGIEFHGTPVVGVVDAPTLRETFAASLGAGCTVNGARCSVTACDDFGLALIGTGFGYKPERRRMQGATVAGLLPDVRDIRRGGSAALDLACVASGRLDGFYEIGLNPWDSCAGTVLVREAGGVATGWADGKPALHPTPELTITGNAYVHSQLAAML